MPSSKSAVFSVLGDRLLFEARRHCCLKHIKMSAYIRSLVEKDLKTESLIKLGRPRKDEINVAR